MGIFGNIFGGIEKGLTAVSGAVSKVYQATLAKVPFIPQVKSFVESNPSIAAGIGVGSALKGIATAPFVKSVPSAIATAATATPKAIAITGITGVVGGSALIAEPKKTISAVVESPTSAVNFLSNVGEFIAKPSVQQAKETFEENPIISTGVLAVGAIAATKGIAGVAIASNLLSDKGEKESTKSILTESNTPTPSSPTEILPTTKPQVIPTSDEKPQTAETTTITTGQKRHRRASRLKEPTRIEQKLNVLVNNRSVGVYVPTEKYIKGVHLV